MVGVPSYNSLESGAELAVIFIILSLADMNARQHLKLAGNCLSGCLAGEL